MCVHLDSNRDYPLVEDRNNDGLNNEIDAHVCRMNFIMSCHDKCGEEKVYYAAAAKCGAVQCSEVQ